MKGVNKIEHRKIISTLMQIEQYLEVEGEHATDVQNARKITEELEQSFNAYEQYVRELEVQINSYRELYDQARVKFLGYKIKELKKRLSQEEFKNF